MNKGSIDAMIDSVTPISLTDAQKKYLSYTITYDDGDDLQVKDLLPNTTGKETLKVRVEFKNDVAEEDLPESSDTMEFNFNITYVQADNSSKARPSTAYSVASSIGTEYTGNTDGIGTKKIYINTSDGSNDNVSFGGFCWKIIRTTETGGTKLLYNGVVSSTGTCENTGTDTSIGTSSFNSSYSSPAYVGYMYDTVYNRISKSMSSDTNYYVFGNDVTYSGGTYTLTPTNASNITINGANWSTSYNTINNNHYTCLTSGTTCTSVYYVYYTYHYTSGDTTTDTIYYIQLDNGKKVEDALDEMLGTNGTDINVTNSTIKTTIENWYAAIMTAYDTYIEDTVYCNDRSISNLNGWNPNGGSTTSYLQFKNYSTNGDLSCSNVNDRFTKSDSIGNGKLSYKVGLMSYPEAYQMSMSSRTSGQYYWLSSPYDFGSAIANGRDVYSSGSISDYLVSYSNGVRPSVSLTQTAKFSSGDGSSTNPYVVKTS